MQELQRIKPYKAKEPYKTITKIRNILEECNIFTKEKHYDSGSKFGLYSCRVTIGDLDDDRRFNIGTNGKGLTSRYASASAYGEFMERLQNGALIRANKKYATNMFLKNNDISDYYKNKLIKEDLVFDYELVPDEKYLSINELCDKQYDVLKNLFQETNKLKLLEYMKNVSEDDMIICAPYFNVVKKEVEYLPISLIAQIVSSNGMCAGNTKEEALIQGICEIFERYTIRKIYADNLTPPTIPIKYFEGFKIYKIIKEMKQTANYSIIVKDCSLGMGLPVIGVLIIDLSKNKYIFHLGSDPSPITSLERCLTEIYQGSIKSKFKDLDLNQDFSRYSKEKFINYLDNITALQGCWPNCIFFDDESYIFKGFNHPISKNDRDDLKYLVDKIFDLNFDLYVRDVSYLGFPSFQVYIPGMSEISSLEGQEGITKFSTVKKYIPIIYNLKNQDSKNIERLANALEEAYESNFVPPKLLEICYFFLPNKNKKLDLLNIELLLIILYYRINNLRKAYKYINMYIEKNISNDEREKYLYYYCVRDYLRFKIYKPSYNIKKILNKLYGKKIALMVIEDLRDPTKIFNDIELPTCFDCINCEIKSDCKYFDLLRYKKILEKKQEENPIDQLRVKNTFE